MQICIFGIDPSMVMFYNAGPEPLFRSTMNNREIVSRMKHERILGPIRALFITKTFHPYTEDKIRRILPLAVKLLKQ